MENIAEFKRKIQNTAQRMRHTWVIKDPFVNASWYKCLLFGHEKINRSDLYKAYMLGFNACYEHCRNEIERSLND
jgi:hypothetical protein